MDNIFLSASIPAKDRNPKYYDTADFVAIREAVLAVATVVVPNYKLIWGGHPAITPLIRTVYQKYLEDEYGKNNGREKLEKDLHTHVLLYQSDFFANVFPKDNDAFEDIKTTPIIDNDRDKSLSRMREDMIIKNDFLLGIFIGGMKGVEDEYNMFVKEHPDTLAFPIISTGAAAGNLRLAPGNCLVESSGLYERSRYDRAYISLLENAIEVAKELRNMNRYKDR